MTDPETLARWLAATKEFSDRPGPYLEWNDDSDGWILSSDDDDGASPRDLAVALLEFIQEAP